MTHVLRPSLELAGERLVMLAAPDGRIWYSGSKVVQPSLATAAERALAEGSCQGCRADRSSTLLGGEGIRYSTGWADTDVQIEVAVHDGLVIAVVNSTRPDSRSRLDSDWYEECPACGDHFQVGTSSGKCATCNQWKCHECRGCECSNARTVICPRCWIALSLAEVAQGLAAHYDC